MPQTYETYIHNTHAGQRLLKAHALTEFGTWQIFGEDGNPGLHGSHHTPELGFVDGQLADVIRYAVELPDFWQWGGGGEIKKMGACKVVTADSGAELVKLREEKKQLEARLEEIKEMLSIK